MRARLVVPFLFLCVAGAALTLGILPGTAEEAPAAVPLKIGVVDLAYIVEHYTRRTDEEEKLRVAIEVEDERNKLINSEIESLKQRIRDLQDQLDSDAPEIVSLKNELEIKRLMLKQRIDFTKRKLEIGKIKILKIIYQDFQRYAKLFAEKNGFDLILSNNPPALEPTPKSYDNFMLQISLQPVYYFREKLDVTMQINDFMNKLYQENKAKAPQPAGPNPGEAKTPAPAATPAPADNGGAK